MAFGVTATTNSSCSSLQSSDSIKYVGYPLNSIFSNRTILHSNRQPLNESKEDLFEDVSVTTSTFEDEGEDLSFFAFSQSSFGAITEDFFRKTDKVEVVKDENASSPAITRASTWNGRSGSSVVSTASSLFRVGKKRQSARTVVGGGRFSTRFVSKSADSSPVGTPKNSASNEEYDYWWGDSDSESLIRKSSSADQCDRWTGEDPDKWKQMHELAAECFQRNELDKAQSLFEEILRAHEDKYGENHQCVGSALHNVGIVHAKAGNDERAFPFLRDAVRVRKATLGKNHPDVVKSQIKLGTVLLKLKDYDSSLLNFREALRSRRSTLGFEHPKVAELLCHVGCVYFETGELLAALSSFEDALEIQNLANEEKPKIAEILSNIGCIRSKRKQYEKAIEVLNEAWALQKSIYGEHHKAVMTTMDNLAFAHSKNGRNDKALKLYKKILRSQTYTKALQSEHIRTLNKMTVVYEKQKNYDAARDCAREILVLQERTLHRSHPDVCSTRRVLARIEQSSLEADKKRGLF